MRLATAFAAPTDFELIQVCFPCHVFRRASLLAQILAAISARSKGTRINGARKISGLLWEFVPQCMDEVQRVSVFNRGIDHDLYYFEIYLSHVMSQMPQLSGICLDCPARGILTAMRGIGIASGGS